MRIVGSSRPTFPASSMFDSSLRAASCRSQSCPRARHRPSPHIHGRSPSIGGEAGEGAAVEPRSEPNGDGERPSTIIIDDTITIVAVVAHVEREGSSLALGRGVGHERRRDGQEGDRRVGQRAGRRDGRVAPNEPARSEARDTMSASAPNTPSE